MSPRQIISNIPQSYEAALKAGDLFFFPSTVIKLVDSDIEFEIRVCPALQKKPTLPSPHFDTVGLPVESDRGAPDIKGRTLDPFSPPYNPNLYVGDLKDEESQEEFVILLNKFSVVPHHFLLVTKEFKSQTSPLLPSELVQAYTLISTASRAGKHFFAFYNCGENSGASQPHKHIQFIPLNPEDPKGPPIEHLAGQVNLETPDKPFSLTKLSFANHVFRLSPRLDTYPLDELERVLSSAFMQLLDLVISTIRHDPDYPPGKPSYNVMLTLNHLYLIPRRRETHTLQATGEKLSVNALGFAGMLLVKSHEELEALKDESISKILRGVGLQSVHDLQVEGQ